MCARKLNLCLSTFGLTWCTANTCLTKGIRQHGQTDTCQASPNGQFRQALLLDQHAQSHYQATDQHSSSPSTVSSGKFCCPLPTSCHCHQDSQSRNETAYFSWIDPTGKVISDANEHQIHRIQPKLLHKREKKKGLWPSKPNPAAPWDIWPLIRIYHFQQ